MRIEEVLEGPEAELALRRAGDELEMNEAFNALTDNCENFASRIIRNKDFSKQVWTGIGLAALGVGVIIIAKS